MLSVTVGLAAMTALPASALGTGGFDAVIPHNVEADAPTSGKCGDNVNWELQDSKLVITGSGEMNVFDTINAAPWYPHHDLVTEVYIGEGVTTVTPCGFGNMSKLVKVTIPSTAKYIGRLAFSNCTALTSVDIPAGVQYLGQGAFKSCSSLQSVTIRGSDTAIKGGNETISNKGSQYDPNYSFSGTIYGVSGSKAESYAKNNGIRFQIIGSAQQDTTTTTTSKTTTTTSTTPTTTTTTTTVPPVKEPKLGDVNSDGLIDAVDASMVLSEYAKVSSNIKGSFSDNQKKAADVDENSLIDAVDASKILSYYAYVSSGSGQKVTLSEFIKK